jgi:outer membrane protein assembly factor BamB
MFSHDIAHTGQSQYMGPAGASVDVVWQFKSGDIWCKSPAIAQDGTIYVASYNGTVYQIDSTGRQGWTHATGGVPGDSVAIGEGNVIYVVFTDSAHSSNVHALDSSTGLLLWSYTTPGTQGSGMVSSPVIGADGTVYVASILGAYALDGVSGALKWNSSLISVMGPSTPAIGKDGTIYIGSTDTYQALGVFALDGATGAAVWVNAGVGSISSTPCLGPDGTVFVVADNSTAYALNGATGAVVWTQTLDGDSWASCAIGSKGFLYVHTVTGNITALNSNTGAIVWKHLSSGLIDAAPTIGADGTLYVSSAPLKALNGLTGAEIWSFTLPYGQGSTPAVAADGSIIIGSTDGSVYAIGAPAA